MKHVIRALVLVPCLLLAAGCGKAPPGAAEDAAAADPHAGHDHAEGPHGGRVVALEGHAGHIEILHDRAAGEVRLHVLDQDLEPMTVADAPVLNLKLRAGPKQIRGVAQEEGAVLASAWRFRDPALADEPESARFRLKLGSLTFSPAFKHEHEHEGEEAHEHEGHEGD